MAGRSPDSHSTRGTPPHFDAFVGEIEAMWAAEPHFTAQQLRAITTPTWIVDGDHEEAIKRENTEFMAAQIPGAGLLIQPQVSHFSFLQDPDQFNADLLRFLELSAPRVPRRTR
jgi:pimeloyl-ACP methyl ester carboxylesterase